MESRIINVTLFVASVAVVCGIAVNGYLHSSGLHVCLSPQSNQPQQPAIQVETYCQPIFKRYMAMCPSANAGYKLCSRYTTIYHIAYRRRYVPPPTVQERYTCCPGWRQAHRYAKGCTEAICSQECQNGGRCLRPDNCACPSGWTGQYCELDINECETDTHGCHQQCVNTNGSYTCECQNGFTLGEDGRSCSICVSCSPEFQFILARVQLLEEDVRQLRQNQTLHAAPPPAQIQKPPQNINALPALNDQYIAQIQRIGSLSEQIAMLEERLADCSCRRRTKG
ncbi:epidermal growth factor-like protein 8 [Diadema setosum]|uniref:epidermal growth factor-like protein 8 n=1 Tax=Diadema setosum TaxID=31175 RepID=UPI003B3B004E